MGEVQRTNDDFVDRRRDWTPRRPLVGEDRLLRYGSVTAVADVPQLAIMRKPNRPT